DGGTLPVGRRVRRLDGGAPRPRELRRLLDGRPRRGVPSPPSRSASSAPPPRRDAGVPSGAPGDPRAGLVRALVGRPRPASHPDAAPGARDADDPPPRPARP